MSSAEASRIKIASAPCQHMHGRPTAAALRELLSRSAHGKPGGNSPAGEGEKDSIPSCCPPPTPTSSSSHRKQVLLCAPPQNLFVSQAHWRMRFASGQPPRLNGASIRFGVMNELLLRAAASRTCRRCQLTSPSPLPTPAAASEPLQLRFALIWCPFEGPLK